MIELIIPGKPMGKQRGRTFIHNKTGKSTTLTPKETVNYETFIKQIFAMSGVHGYFEGALRMKVTAYFEIPKSASKKQKGLMLNGGLRPTKKPDMDNIYKIVADALNTLAYHDDSQIVEAYVEKYYALEPRVEVRIEKLNKEETA